MPQTSGQTSTPHIQPKYGADMRAPGCARYVGPGPRWPTRPHIYSPSSAHRIKPSHFTSIPPPPLPPATQAHLQRSPASLAWRAGDLNPSPLDPSTPRSSHVVPRRRWLSGLHSQGGDFSLFIIRYSVEFQEFWSFRIFHYLVRILALVKVKL